MELKRVVVTGMGLLSPLGNTVADSWAKAKAGESGIRKIETIDTSALEIHIAGELRGFDGAARFGAKEARRMDRVTQMAIVASEEALKDSGLQITAENSYDIACYIGTGIGAIQTLMDALDGFREKGHRGVNPIWVPALLMDNISARVSMHFGVRGPNFCIISACATGNNVIGEATNLIRMGRARAAIAGCSEAAIVATVLSGFNNVKALSNYAGDPTKASRPFDKNRDGFVAGEGAGVLILEDLDHALARGAKIYAEVTGYGHTSDAYHVTAPLEDGSAAAKAMQFALQEAGLKPENIDYINAHGTSTPLNDKSETAAVKRALGDYAYQVPISSTKSMTGHILGATSAVEAVFSVMAIVDNFATPTINLETPDPECDLDYVPNVGRSIPINHVISNSFGFGGHNTVLIFSRHQN
jgi:3-oxoacyl-[acyl-carrier-protein] synthase II